MCPPNQHIVRTASVRIQWARTVTLQLSRDALLPHSEFGVRAEVREWWQYHGVNGAVIPGAPVRISLVGGACVQPGPAEQGNTAATWSQSYNCSASSALAGRGYDDGFKACHFSLPCPGAYKLTACIDSPRHAYHSGELSGEECGGREPVECWIKVNITELD